MTITNTNEVTVDAGECAVDCPVCGGECFIAPHVVCHFCGGEGEVTRFDGDCHNDKINAPCPNGCDDGWVDMGIAQVDFFPEGHAWRVCPVCQVVKIVIRL